MMRHSDWKLDHFGGTPTKANEVGCRQGREEHPRKMYKTPAEEKEEVQGLRLHFLNSLLVPSELFVVSCYFSWVCDKEIHG